jgi:3-deoxy-D-manno-octulosonic-acid transferase
MVFGPNMQNFTDIARDFVSQNAAVQAANPEMLENALAELLADENRREELGRNARRVVQKNLGAMGRTADLILENLKGRGIYMVAGK